MEKNRLEAFSDGVLAIIITIMVLEIKTPSQNPYTYVAVQERKGIASMVMYTFHRIQNKFFVVADVGPRIEQCWRGRFVSYILSFTFVSIY